LRRPTIEYILDHSGASYLLVDEEFAPALATVDLPGLHVVHRRADDAYEAFLTGASAADPESWLEHEDETLLGDRCPRALRVWSLCPVRCPRGACGMRFYSSGKVPARISEALVDDPPVPVDARVKKLTKDSVPPNSSSTTVALAASPACAIDVIRPRSVSPPGESAKGLTYSVSGSS
jgi:hypothetical protein